MREGLHEDPRKFASSYLISEEDVDVFKHDVKPRAQPKKKNVRKHCILSWSLTQRNSGRQ
jgi:hypothetical protein